MNRRRLLLIAVSVTLVMIGVGVIMLRQMPPRTAITRANAAKIQPGMTLEEVEDILGGPARFVPSGRISYSLAGVAGFDPAAPRPPEWTSDEVLVLVYLDGNRCVQRCVAVDVRREDGVIDIIRGWFAP